MGGTSGAEPVGGVGRWYCQFASQFVVVFRWTFVVCRFVLSKYSPEKKMAYRRLLDWEISNADRPCSAQRPYGRYFAPLVRVWAQANTLFQFYQHCKKTVWVAWTLLWTVAFFFFFLFFCFIRTQTICAGQIEVKPRKRLPIKLQLWFIISCIFLLTYTMNGFESEHFMRVSMNIRCWASFYYYCCFFFLCLLGLCVCR